MIEDQNQKQQHKIEKVWLLDGIQPSNEPQSRQTTTDQSCCQKLCKYQKENKCFIFCIVQCVTIATQIYFSPLKDHLFSFMKKQEEIINSWYQNHTIKFNIITTTIFTAYVIILQPGRFIFTLLVSYITKSILNSFACNVIGASLGAAIVYILTNQCCKVKIYNRYKDNIHFQVITEMIEENPCKWAPVIWAFGIPSAQKCYLLSLSPLTFTTYMITMYPYFLLFNYLLTMVGVGLKNMDEIKENRSFSQKTPEDIAFFVFTLIFGILNVVFMVVAAVIFKQRLEKKKLALENSALNT